MLEFRITIPEARDLVNRLGSSIIVRRELAVVMRRVALVVERNVARAAPVDTGRLRGSISSEVTDFLGFPEARVFSEGVEYTAYVIGGTRPHVIRAKVDPNNPRHSLAFKGPSGRMIYRKQVSHPGTAPNNFFQEGYRRSKPDVDRRLELAANRIAARLARRGG